MRSKNGAALFTGMVIFTLLIGAAILKQSAYILFAASAVPILLVPFIPDIPTNQKLKSKLPSSPIRMYRTSEYQGEGLLIIDAAPGAIHWNKRLLYFPIDGNIPLLPEVKHGANATGIPVMLYDLVRHSRKKHMLGIQLRHLIGRLQTLPYTTDEITRLVIRMEDLEYFAASGTQVRTPAVAKGLEA